MKHPSDSDSVVCGRDGGNSSEGEDSDVPASDRSAIRGSRRHASDKPQSPGPVVTTAKPREIVKGSLRAITFLQPDCKDEEEHHNDDGSGKVAPVDARGALEIRSQSSAGQSKLSANGMHKVIEAGMKTEDGVLILLRRLLILLLTVVIGLSIATTVISKSVIKAGITQATLADLTSFRTLFQQVWCFPLSCLCPCCRVCLPTLHTLRRRLCTGPS